jgi:hypothetical protein
MGFFQTVWADIEAGWAKLFGNSGPTVVAAIEADIKVVGSALTGVAATLESLAGLSSTTVASIQSTIAAIEAGAIQVVTGIETNIAQPIVTQVVNDFQVLETALAGISLPTALANILKAVTTLLPYIEAGVGILTAGNAMAAKTVQASEATGLSHDEAYSILNGAAPAVAFPAVGMIGPHKGSGPGAQAPVMRPNVQSVPLPTPSNKVPLSQPAVALPVGVVNDDGSVTNPDGSTTYANPGSGG